MQANYYRVGDERMERGEVHLSHAIERGIGYGQLWFNGQWHLEFTKEALAQLAADAQELADNL